MQNVKDILRLRTIATGICECFMSLRDASDEEKERLSETSLDTG